MDSTSRILESLKSHPWEKWASHLGIYRKTSEKERVLFIKVLQKKFDHMKKSQMWSNNDKGSEV